MMTFGFWFIFVCIFCVLSVLLSCDRLCDIAKSFADETNKGPRNKSKCFVCQKIALDIVGSRMRKKKT